jgi:hypothetical protein
MAYSEGFEALQVVGYAHEKLASVADGAILARYGNDDAYA